MKLTSKILRQSALLAAILATFTVSAHAQIYSVSYNTLSEIDTTTGAVIASVSTTDGSNMETVTVSDGIVYVAGQSADQSELNISTYNTSLGLINASVATTPTRVSQDDGALSDAAAITVSDGVIYLNNDTYNDGSIDTVNISTGAVTPSLVSKHDVHDDFTGIAVGNGMIYGSLFQAGVVQTFDPTTGEVLNSDFITIPHNDSPGLIALSADGSTLYVVDHSNGDNADYYDSVLAYNAITGEAENLHLLDGYGANGTNGNVGGLYIDGQNLYVTESNSGVLSDYDSSNGIWVGDVANNAGGQFSVTNSLPPVDPVGGTPGNGEGSTGNQGLPGNGEGSTGNQGLPGAAPEPRSWALAGIVLAMFAGIFKFQRANRREIEA
jgi:hypothetical protein